MDKWNLPGGGLEINETIREGLVREIEEETGLIVETEKLVGIYEKRYKAEKVFVYKCSIIGGEIRLSDESKDVRYFPAYDLPDNIIDSHKKRIEDFAQLGGDKLAHEIVPSKIGDNIKTIDETITGAKNLYKLLLNSFQSYEKFIEENTNKESVDCERMKNTIDLFSKITKDMIQEMADEITDKKIEEIKSEIKY